MPLIVGHCISNIVSIVHFLVTVLAHLTVLLAAEPHYVAAGRLLILLQVEVLVVLEEMVEVMVLLLLVLVYCVFVFDLLDHFGAEVIGVAGQGLPRHRPGILVPLALHELDHGTEALVLVRVEVEAESVRLLRHLPYLLESSA